MTDQRVCRQCGKPLPDDAAPDDKVCSLVCFFDFWRVNFGRKRREEENGDD